MPITRPSQARAILFDLDGTLVDSEREVQDAVAGVLQRRDRPLSAPERDYVVGHAWGDIYANLLRHGPVPLSLPELEAAVFEERRQRLARGAPLPALPGAADAVRHAAARAPLGLVTGSSLQEAELMLGALGVRACFQALSCAGDYPRGKPAPDPYLLCAGRLAVPPALCLVVEDSTAGIASARAAGMFCVAVQAGNFAGQDQSAADLVLADLRQFDAWLQTG